MSVQRWNVVLSMAASVFDKSESDDGEYVLFADHERAVAEAREHGYARGNYDGKVCEQHGHAKVCPEKARMAAFLEAYEKMIELNDHMMFCGWIAATAHPIDLPHDYDGWLRARAEEGKP